MQFLLWLSSNEPDQEPWGLGFHPWPHSVGTDMSCSVGCWYHSCWVAFVWHRPAVVAPIGPLAWEFPYAAGAPPPQKKTQTATSSVAAELWVWSSTQEISICLWNAHEKKIKKTDRQASNPFLQWPIFYSRHRIGVIDNRGDWHHLSMFWHHQSRVN